MTESTSTALVTGANKGLGRETARRLGALGWTVFLGCRDRGRGEAAAAELVAGGADAHVVQLDVTSDESVAAAAEDVGRRVGHLDTLVNNAGITGPVSRAHLIGPGGPPGPPPGSTGDPGAQAGGARSGAGTPGDPLAGFGPMAAVLGTGPEDFLGCFGVNLLGPVRVTRAFLPLLASAEVPRVVMVSSGMGSMAVTTDPDRLESAFVSLIYTSSKAALNMVTTQYAKALPGWKVNAADPGYTATDLNGNSGARTVEQGAEVIVGLATTGPDGPTGGFFDDTGPVPW